MSLVSLLQKQVESRALIVCQNRNRSLPVELGKSCFESFDCGVEFIKQHYLLDSTHMDYTSSVARVEWNPTQACWHLMIPKDSNQPTTWLPYPYLIKSQDLTAIMREIDKDPKSLFWD